MKSIIHKNIIDDKLEIAPMLLLPFVENAFKHGAQIDGIVNVLISLKVDENELNFTVKNSAISKENSKKGLGLDNIKKRLEMFYPAQHFLEVLQEEKVFIVNFKILIRNEE